VKILFEPAARREFDGIFEWVAKQNARAANDLVARIEAKVMRLQAPNLAHMGRPGLVEGTRELVEYPYIIVYRVDDRRGEVVIVSVVHGARDRRPG
jgi:plasmid stabilization system protein ParE